MKTLFLFLSFVFFSVPAWAAMDITATTMDLSSVEVVLALVVVVVIAMWGYRKLIKLANKS